MGRATYHSTLESGAMARFDSSDEPTLRVTDELGHDLPGMTADVRRQILLWLGLEEAAGESSPGLRDLRERLQADEEADR